MRILFAALLAASSFNIANVSHAGDGPVVVELYTSQGCSSCPPADELLSKLAKRKDVIALALHVDYWDYIGWKDVFGNPAFTKRQKSYAHAGGHRTIYTPQMVVGGRDHVSGNKPMDVANAISAQRGIAKQVDLEIARKGKTLSIKAVAVAGKASAGKMVFQLVRFNPRQDVKITRGENAGRTIRYSNIVTGWKAIGTWNGTGTKEVSVDIGSSNAPLAVILQQANFGPVIAAAQLR